MRRLIIEAWDTSTFNKLAHLKLVSAGNVLGTAPVSREMIFDIPEDVRTVFVRYAMEATATLTLPREREVRLRMRKDAGDKDDSVNGFEWGQGHGVVRFLLPVIELVGALVLVILNIALVPRRLLTGRHIISGRKYGFREPSLVLELSDPS